MFKSKLYAVMLVLGIFTLLVGACAEPGSTTNPTAALEDKPWVLESYGKPAELQTVLAETRITVTFDSAEGNVQGNAGANNYSGGYQIDGAKISMPLLAATEMYRMDPEGVMDQEYQYLKILQAAESFRIEGGKLRITAGDQILIFIGE